MEDRKADELLEARTTEHLRRQKSHPRLLLTKFDTVILTNAPGEASEHWWSRCRSRSHSFFACLGRYRRRQLHKRLAFSCDC